MNIRKSNVLTPRQLEDALRLWNNEYPEQLMHGSQKELQGYLRTCSQPKHYTVSDDDGNLRAWAYTFLRDNSRWFALIVSGPLQGKGWGRRLLDALKEEKQTLYGWVTDHNRYQKVNGVVYVSPLSFYLKNDFVICPERLETELLSAVKIKWEVDI